MPQAGKTAVLDQLVSQMASEALKALPPEAREKLAAVLVGTEASTATTQKTSLEVVQEMVESYAFDEKTGVSTFIVPAGVTDVQAMRALNEYFSKHDASFKRDAVYKEQLEWYEKLPQEFPKHCQERDYSQARHITVTGVVEGTTEKDRATQEGVLKNESLVFADPREQALAASIHACKHKGDLFKDVWVRGSVPGFALATRGNFGV